MLRMQVSFATHHRFHRILYCIRMLESMDYHLELFTTYAHYSNEINVFDAFCFELIVRIYLLIIWIFIAI